MPATCAASASIVTNIMRGIYLSNAVATHSSRLCLSTSCAESLPFLVPCRLSAKGPSRVLSRRTFTTTYRCDQYVPLNPSGEDRSPLMAKTEIKSKSKSEPDNHASTTVDEDDGDLVLDILPKKSETKATAKTKATGGQIKTLKGKNESAKSKKASSEKKRPEPWQVHKEALKRKFKEGWNPPKKLSPDALDMVRHLHHTNPEEWTTPTLAEAFKVSPEAIRRILKSKWQPSEEARKERQERWERRRDRIWSHMVELGLRQPRKGMEKYSDAAALGLPRPTLPKPAMRKPR